MPESANSQYGIRPWMLNTPPEAPSRPNTYEAFMTQAALAADYEMDDDQIREIQGPLNLTLFPPRFGYRTEALGIKDIANLDDIYRRVDFSQRQSGYQGTSYPSLNQF